MPCAPSSRCRPGDVAAAAWRSAAAGRPTDASGKGFLLEDFEDQGSVGSGSYGQVRKVLHRRTGSVYAMKVIPKVLLQQHNMAEYLEREAATQQRLRHPNILALYQRFEDGESSRLLLEYAAGGSLFWLLRHSQGSRLAPERAAPLFAQVCSALIFLHSNGIVHRDIKPENILLCEGDIAKLADFGWCAELSRGSSGPSSRQTFCGTFDYLSPEMIHDEPHGFGVDVWAMGVLLYEMLLGRPPFASRSQAECVARISKVEFKVPGEVPCAAAELISKFLVREPERRLPLDHALERPFLRAHVEPPLPHAAVPSPCSVAVAPPSPGPSGPGRPDSIQPFLGVAEADRLALPVPAPKALARRPQAAAACGTATRLPLRAARYSGRWTCQRTSGRLRPLRRPSTARRCGFLRRRRRPPAAPQTRRREVGS
eukprot:SRR837773.20275.p1 GENE.SRR837773.20275~~SRR837773.20275.p1  ORF type:complete len:427 (-),score=49.19 SRR837773.20275:274-1554(-)